MDPMILVRSESGGNAAFLEEKVLELKDEFSKEGVSVGKELKKSLEFGAVGGELFIAIVGGVSAGLILMLVEKLLEKEEKTKNVNIQINIKDSNITFNLPKEKEKMVKYLKSKDE